jgi:hypothetical protein
MKRHVGFKDRTGEINYNKYGSEMIIDEYISTNNIWVKFIDTNNKVHTNYYEFSKGNVKNVYDKIIYGVGYLGEGKYNGKISKQYYTWRNILIRCYDKVFREKHKTYKDATIIEEWQNFQNFASWYDENYYEIEGERMELDKDILVKGNKLYSPETCVFVPHSINTMFVKSNAIRGKYPIGVSYRKDTNNFESYYQNKGKKIRLGGFNTPEEAFQAHKIYKEKYIKEVAEEYKNKIPNKLYEAMINYIIEIND